MRQPQDADTYRRDVYVCSLQLPGPGGPDDPRPTAPAHLEAQCLLLCRRLQLKGDLGGPALPRINNHDGRKRVRAVKDLRPGCQAAVSRTAAQAWHVVLQRMRFPRGEEQVACLPPTLCADQISAVSAGTKPSTSLQPTAEGVSSPFSRHSRLSCRKEASQGREEATRLPLVPHLSCTGCLPKHTDHHLKAAAKDGSHLQQSSRRQHTHSVSNTSRQGPPAPT